MISAVGAGNKDSKISDFMVIDPYPMTTEQRAQYETAQQHAELEQSTQRMAAMFEE